VKILHFVPSIDAGLGITSKYISVLCSETGTSAEVHIACGKSLHPVKIDNATVHYIPYGKKNLYSMRASWLKLLYEIMPDIVHIHGCWSYSAARALRLSKNRGFRTLLSSHGQLEPWIMKQHLFKEKIPKILAYQWRTVNSAFAIQVMGDIEYENIKSLKWNKRIVTVKNSLITGAITDKKMAEEILLLYRKIMDTEVYCLMNVHTKESFYRLLHAGLTGERINDFPQIDYNGWRQMLIFANNEGISDMFQKGCALQSYAYPEIDVNTISTFCDKKNDRQQNIKDTTSVEEQIYKRIRLLYKGIFRKRLPTKPLCELAYMMRNNDYNEATLAKMLRKGKITKFSGRIEQILNEITGLEEGFMPVKSINDFLTDRIKKIYINNLTI
jgi:hypothetical protein